MSSKTVYNIGKQYNMQFPKLQLYMKKSIVSNAFKYLFTYNNRFVSSVFPNIIAT